MEDDEISSQASLPTQKREETNGRPVEVTADSSGALLVADDTGNTVWRVSPASK